MITGKLRNQIDEIWNTFWTGGISNPLSVIEQMTFLLFIRRLDEEHTRREQQANLLGREVERPVFNDRQQQLRWSRFKNLGSPQQLYDLFRDEVFPFLRSYNPDPKSLYARMMKDAVFMIGTPSLLSRVVDLFDKLEMPDRDTKGDVYEYMLSKLEQAGQNGQFRTPRHIIRLMVNLVQPRPADRIADPAAGTAGFLMAAGEYLREQHPEMLHDERQREYFQREMFHGGEFDASMLRIGAMNLILHGIENPDISSADSLSTENAVRDAYTLILANPPFKGSLDFDGVAKDLLQTVKTKKTELLFLALFLKQLRPGGRCACIVPDGVLFNSSNAHKDLRKLLVDGHKLDGVISMPSGVFKPYAGVSTAILLFTRTDSGGTDRVWFYDMHADGFSLDDKRTEIAANDIPDIQARWHARHDSSGDDRRAQAFFVPVAEIRENGYDLSINRYQEIEYAEITYPPPQTLLDELEQLETEILQDLQTLREMLG